MEKWGLVSLCRANKNFQLPRGLRTLKQSPYHNGNPPPKNVANVMDSCRIILP